MPITTLDTNTALIVIDLQAGIAALPTAHPMAEVVQRAVALARSFRQHGLPVVLVNVDGVAPGRSERAPRTTAFPAGWTNLLPELERYPDDHIVTKRTWGAFTGTDLEPWLRERGVTQVVVVGVATSAGVESTARFAHELGFNVALAVDAMTDMSLEAHDNSVQRIFPKLAETGTCDDVLALLEGQAD